MRMLSCLSTRRVSPKIMRWLSLPRICYPSTRISVWSQKPGLKNLDTWKPLWVSMVTHSSEKTEKGEEEVYVPILKHRLLRQFTTHLAGNKKNNLNSSGFVVNQSPVIQSFFIALYTTHQIQFTNLTIINAILTDIEDICTKYPGSVISIVRDFNKLDTTKFETEAGLVQFVTEPTHGRISLINF